MDDQFSQDQPYANEQPPQEAFFAEEAIPETIPKRRLGRGLNALLGGSGPANEPYENSTGSTQGTSEELGNWSEVAISRIQRNPNQPRKQFDSETLNELAESIRKHGVLQPILVREYGDNYELVAGERRWLAAKQAGLSAVPCRVVDVIDKTAIEFAFEENLKRQDLSDLEKAQAFRDYIDVFETTAEELAKQLSMSRSAVSNTMRLLELPVPAKNALQQNQLTAGHARAILSLKDESAQLDLCDLILKERMTVRQAEAAAKKLQGGSETLPFPGGKPQPPELTNHLKSLQHQLRDSLNVKVEFKLKTNDSGQVVLHFANQHDFERILERLQHFTQQQAAA